MSCGIIKHQSGNEKQNSDSLIVGSGERASHRLGWVGAASQDIDPERKGSQVSREKTRRGGDP